MGKKKNNKKNKINRLNEQGKEPVNMDSSKRAGYCPECGNPINNEEHVNFCNMCGVRLAWPDPEF